MADDLKLPVPLLSPASAQPVMIPPHLNDFESLDVTPSFPTQGHLKLKTACGCCSCSCFTERPFCYTYNRLTRLFCLGGTEYMNCGGVDGLCLCIQKLACCGGGEDAKCCTSDDECCSLKTKCGMLCCCACGSESYAKAQCHCCKFMLQLCCCDWRCALPTDADVPCEFGCCGYMCKEAEAPAPPPESIFDATAAAFTGAAMTPPTPIVAPSI